MPPLRPFHISSRLLEVSVTVIIRAYRDSDLDRLFHHWTEVGREIPHVFSVSPQRWRRCLLEDQLDGHLIFRSLETYLAAADDKVLGFIQWGQPTVAWDERGQPHLNPHIGVIRHLSFERGRPDVGEALLAAADGFTARFDRAHAFYHILGMSCNAHHGKLHCSQFHVEGPLRARGFEVEHENAYYVLDMTGTPPPANSRLRLRAKPHSDDQRFVMQLGERRIGAAHVRYLDRLTDGYTRDTAYLSWISVDEPHRGKGFGTELLMLLVQRLLGKGYRYLHTDTAAGNYRARRFYGKLGFRQAGLTRSYVRLQKQESSAP